jgi:hypothetical protein
MLVIRRVTGCHEYYPNPFEKRVYILYTMYLYKREMPGYTIHHDINNLPGTIPGLKSYK